MRSKVLVAFGTLVLTAALVLPASAQVRGGTVVRRAVPRASVARVVRPGVVGVAPYYPYFAPSFGVGFYYGYPFFGGYPYAYGYPAYGYPAYGYAASPYGGVRIVGADKKADVYADGYYVGTVDDFDGVFQELTLVPGPHRIEIREGGLAPLSFDVYVQPGQTITYRAAIHTT
jgi:hypothetical protein